MPLDASDRKGEGMKRLLLMVVTALSAAAVMVGSGGAAIDAKGPPCTNVVGGGDTLAYVAPGDGTGTVEATFILGAPACAAASYLLDIYSFDGQTWLVEDVQPTSISGDHVFFRYQFSSGAPSNGVCLEGTTYFRGRLIDTVPDNGCAPVENGSSGGFGGWN
jgi:hypothetical protein